MRLYLLQRGLGVLALTSLIFGAFPGFVAASSLVAPSDLDVVGGVYTNDTTPTVTWDASYGATWYSIARDTGSYVDIGNVLSYTFSTLSEGWHTFYVVAHDESGHSSSAASITIEIDITGPTVPAMSPTYAYEDEATTFSVSPYGESAPGNCDLYVDGSYVGSMTKTSATYYKSYTFSSSGSHSMYARCVDGDGNYTSGTVTTITVYSSHGSYDDTFVVPAVSPSYAYENDEVTFSVTPYGDLDAVYCDLYVDDFYDRTTPVGSMSERSGTFSRSYTFTREGTYTAYAYCEDEDGGWVRGDDTTVTVYASGDNRYEYPVVPQVSPSSAIEDEEITIWVEPEEDAYGDEVRWCDLYVDGDNVGDMDESRGEFFLDYTFRSSGYYTVYAVCTDENYDTTVGDYRSIYVSSYDVDEDFVVPRVSPSSAAVDEEVTFSVEPYGNLDAESCKLYVDGDYVGRMTEDRGEFSREYTFDDDGDYVVYAYCEDEDGDWHKGESRTVEVRDEHSDTDLDVPAVTPSTAEEDVETTFTIRPESRYNITSCWLYVDDKKVAYMDEESSNRFVAEYTFTRSGSYVVYAVCEDSSGDEDTGDKRTVYVSDEHIDDEADVGSLIKLSCGASSEASDPCRAVYYYGEDGERHAFPNESTYFTWYRDFDDVIEVSTAFMYSLDIGENVTYRPGSVLVKFESSTAVYAIEAPRTLRHYQTWSLLEGDYGDDGADVIVVLPDSLYANYDLGDRIDSSSDYDRTDAYYSVDDIEDIF